MKLVLFIVVTALLVVTPALASTDLVNEDCVLAVGATRSYAFQVGQATLVSVDMTPVKHADKGVMLRIAPAEDAAACAGTVQGQCRARPGFEGASVRSFSHAEQLPAGKWVLLVQNRYNDFFSATVHVHLVAN